MATLDALQGRLRWVADVYDWHPSDEEWDLLLSTVPEDAQRRIHRFRLPMDRRRALLSELLQRRCIHEIYGLGREEIRLARSEANKPYLLRTDSVLEAERVRECARNLNFNCSHHGAKVVLVSEPDVAVGVDVVDELSPLRGADTVDEFFRAFQRHFTIAEWECIEANAKEIRDEAHDVARLRQFYRYWAVKESYVKALGIGLGFDLHTIEFVISSDGSSIRAKLRGQALDSAWTFSLHNLDERHIIAIAVEAPSVATQDRIEHLPRFMPVRASELLVPCDPSSALEIKDLRYRLLVARSNHFNWEEVDAEARGGFMEWLFGKHVNPVLRVPKEHLEISIWNRSCPALTEFMAGDSRSCTLLIICGFRQFLDHHQLRLENLEAARCFFDTLRKKRPDVRAISVVVEMSSQEEPELHTVLAALDAAERCGLQTRPVNLVGRDMTLIPSFGSSESETALGLELNQQVRLEYQTSWISTSSEEPRYPAALIFNHNNVHWSSADVDARPVDTFMKSGLQTIDLLKKRESWSNSNLGAD